MTWQKQYDNAVKRRDEALIAYQLAEDRHQRIVDRLEFWTDLILFVCALAAFWWVMQ